MSHSEIRRMGWVTCDAPQDAVSCNSELSYFCWILQVYHPPVVGPHLNATLDQPGRRGPLQVQLLHQGWGFGGQVQLGGSLRHSARHERPSAGVQRGTPRKDHDHWRTCQSRGMQCDVSCFCFLDLWISLVFITFREERLKVLDRLDSIVVKSFKICKYLIHHLCAPQIVAEYLKPQSSFAVENTLKYYGSKSTAADVQKCKYFYKN